MNEIFGKNSVGLAGSITTIGIIFARSIQYIASIFFIAFLSPEVIGEYALALFILMAIFSLFTTGIDSRIISMDSDNEFLKESWSIEVIRGFLIFSISILIFLYGLVTNTISLMHSYLLILGISMLIRCSKNINMVIARKNLNMMPIFFIELGSSLAFFVVSVTLLMIFKNGWALPLGYLAGSISYTYLSFYILPTKDSKFIIDFNNYYEIFVYSKWINFSAQIVSFFENVIPLIISYLFGVFNLGLFEKSDQFSRKIITQLTQVFWIVGLPWSSKENKINENTSNIFSTILLFFITTAVPILAAISIIIPDFLVYIGGEKWSNTKEIIYALCLVSAIACFNVPFGILMQAIKLPELSLYAGLIKLFSFIVGLYFFGTNNIINFIYVLAFSNLVSLIYYLIVCFVKLNWNMTNVLNDIFFLFIPFIIFKLFFYENIIGAQIGHKLIFAILFFIFNFIFSFFFSSVRRNILINLNLFIDKLKKK